MKENDAYQRARQKVQMLIDFYRHLISYILINSGLILWWSNLFGSGKTNFSNPGIYVVAFFWGIGLFFHALHVFSVIHFQQFGKKWEERKIRELMEKEEAEYQNSKPKHQ